MANYVTPVNQFLKSIDVQPYDRYLPNAFNDSLTMLEKVNKVVEQLNQSNQLTNLMIKEWNEFAEWFNIEYKNVKNLIKDELTDERIENLTKGSIDSIVNKNLSNITKRIDNISINVDSFGAIGDGVTDDTEAFRNAFEFVTNNHLTLTTDFGKTYIIDDLIVSGKNNFKVVSPGILKRKNNLPPTSSATSTIIFENCSNFKIEEINFDGNHLNNHCVVNRVPYNNEYLQEFRHCIVFRNCQNVKVGTIFGKNPSGDVLTIIGENTSNIEIGSVEGLSVDENNSHIPLGRNTVSIIQGKSIFINLIKSFGVGHVSMPGGLDIEPNNGQWVSDIYINTVHVVTGSMSGLGITTKYGNGNNIRNVTIENIYINSNAVGNKRLLIVAGATNVKLGKCYLKGMPDSYGLHVGLAGNSQAVYNLQIDRLEVETSLYGAMLDNLYNSRIKLISNDCFGNFIRLYKVKDSQFDITGYFNPNSKDDRFCLYFYSDTIKENCVFSGDISKTKVGINSVRALATNSTNESDILNCKLENLDMSDWWMPSSNVIRGLAFKNLYKVNCKGLTDTNDFNVDAQICFKIGDVIKNNRPIEQGETGKKYIVTGWIITGIGDGTVLTTSKLELRSLTGN